MKLFFRETATRWTQGVSQSIKSSTPRWTCAVSLCHSHKISQTQQGQAVRAEPLFPGLRCSSQSKTRGLHTWVQPVEVGFSGQPLSSFSGMFYELQNQGQTSSFFPAYPEGEGSRSSAWDLTGAPSPGNGPSHRVRFSGLKRSILEILSRYTPFFPLVF